MKSVTILSLLALAASTDAFSVKSVLKHVFKRGADPTKCLRANHYDWVSVNDAKVPPCWIENAGKFDCYEYKTGNQCDNWPGMFDVTKKDKPSGKSGKSGKIPADYCDQANLGTKCHPKDAKCPPCWVQNGSKYDCYAKVNGQCPWGGMIDIE